MTASLTWSGVTARRALAEPSADLPMWTGALSVLPSPVPIHPEGVRFTPGQADEVIAAIGEALAEAELTVDELTDALASRPGPWAVERTMDAFQDKWPRWRQLTSTAAHRGVLCFGPDRGRKVTYTNPHRWVPGFRPADGETPRERLYPGAAAARALTASGQAGNYPVLLVDGVVGGVWHQRRSGRKLTITVEPLAELTARQRRELDDEAALVGTVMEATPTLTVGPVTVGPHA
jgi:hypothetical protein